MHHAHKRESVFLGPGDDYLRVSGSEIVLNGGGGNDYLEVDYASGLTGLYGQEGDDTLVASVPDSGQVHIGGGAGNDHIIMDLTNASGRQGHHVYGGPGADRFEFTGLDAVAAPVVGRLDDFDFSEDSIWLEGERLDLRDLPDGLRVVEYLGQQWLSLADRALYAFEGARNGGDEAHFASLPPDGIVALPEVTFSDPQNFLPSMYFEGRPKLRELERPESLPSFVGTSRADYIHDYHVDRLDNDGTPIGHANSRIRAGGGNDRVDAGKGDDWVWGNKGHDALAGGSDNDKLFGGPGRDALYGGTEADLLIGGRGSDRLWGNAGVDILKGGKGRDFLTGGGGADVLVGGRGADVFVFAAGDLVSWRATSGEDSERLLQLDRIRDFRPGVDKIRFSWDSGIEGLSDLRAWKVDLNEGVHFAIEANAAGGRVLVGVPNGTDWGDLFHPDNFLFG